MWRYLLKPQLGTIIYVYTVLLSGGKYLHVAFSSRLHHHRTANRIGWKGIRDYSVETVTYPSKFRITACVVSPNIALPVGVRFRPFRKT